jgi:glycogen operon protein
VSLLTARRLLRDLEAERHRLSLNDFLRAANIAWHGVKLDVPDWRDCSHSIAFSAELRRENLLIHFILNAYWEPLDFELPLVANGEREPWRRWIDTSLAPPDDIVEWQAASTVSGHSYRIGARSVAVLFSRRPNPSRST